MGIGIRLQTLSDRTCHDADMPHRTPIRGFLPPAACAALVALAACDHPAAEGELGPRASAVTSAAPAPPPETAFAEVPPPALSAAPSEPETTATSSLAPVEAKRVTLRSLAEERALAPQQAAIAQHFGGAIPSPLELQITELGGARRAFLAYGEARARNPMILAFDDKRELLWTKERPLAGTRQVVTEMVLAPGPRGEVALMWCDIPTQVVGLRKWSTDGTVLADFEVLEVDLCEALSGLYWPGRGWIAAASQHGAARVQLLDEAGKRAWGPRGNELPWSARPSAPASIAIDSDVSLIVFQVGDRPGGALNRVLAMRYDTLGTALWDKPLDLGPAPASPRLAVTRVEPGKVKIALGAGTAIVTSLGMILGAR
jgi:hypothetical protein